MFQIKQFRYRKIEKFENFKTKHVEKRSNEIESKSRRHVQEFLGLINEKINQLLNKKKLYRIDENYEYI